MGPLFSGLRTTLRRARKLLRLIAEGLRIVLVRLEHGAGGFPSDLRIAAGVRIGITDGGSASFARGCSIDRGATLLAKHGRLRVGERVHVGIGAVIVARASIEIGSDVLIAEYVTIRDQDHVFDGTSPTHMGGFRTTPVVIGDNVWLGAKVTVTRGVTIGRNAVIAANSVVTRDIPPNVLAAGAPARVLRNIAPEQAGDRAGVTLP